MEVKEIKAIKDKVLYIFSKRDKRIVFLLMIMTIVGSVLELLGVAIFMPFVNIIMNPEYISNSVILSTVNNILGLRDTKSFELFLCIIIILIYVVKNIYLLWQKNITYKFSFRIQKDLATKLLKSYMRQPYTFHLKKNIADMQRSLEADVANFSGLVMQVLELIAELGVCFLMGIYLLTVSKTITIVVVGLLIICVLGFAVITKNVSQGLGKDCQGYRSKIYQWINQSLGGIKEVKILSREDYFLESYSSYYEKYAKSLQLLRLISIIPKYIVEAVCMTGLVLAIIIKILFGEADMIHFIPQLTVFATAAFRLLPSVGRISGYLSYIMSSIPSLDLVFHDLKEVEDLEFIEEHKDKIKESSEFKEAISLKNVSYRYPDGVEKVVEDVNLVIPKGKTIAFIGPSGAGKTTIVDIILGLLSPTEGKVYVDNMDIADNLDGWHKHIGYIPQTIYLSDDTIRANVAFGIDEEEIDDEAVRDSIKKAQLDEFINSLPEGLDTYVGDRGVRLSGGQRQRIGIARALYHKPEVLVLDEATSALDNDTEAAVMEAIDSLKGQKTMIIIAHRLTTIRNADVVYEVSGGCVTRK